MKKRKKGLYEPEDETNEKVIFAVTIIVLITACVLVNIFFR